MACSICSQLDDYEHGMQTGGREDEDTFLPDAAYLLKQVCASVQTPDGEAQIWQCPECGGHYLHRSSYEYIVYGSEDEQFLTRLSAKEAADYLAKCQRMQNAEV